MDLKEIIKNKQLSHRKINMPSIICSISNIQDSKTDNRIEVFLEDRKLGLSSIGIRMIKQD